MKIACLICMGPGPRGVTLRSFLVLLLLSVTIGSTQVKAQWYLKENIVFAFGIYTGFDFRTGVPVPIATGTAGTPTSQRPPQGFTTGLANASVCDTSGNLLFYTNGSHAWDRRHTPMPNGLPIHTGAVNTIGLTQACSQGAMIVPFIGDTNRYYIFSHVSPASSGDLRYSVVDMRLNGGYGDLVAGQKWIRLAQGLSGSLVAVPGNQCNIWVIAHARDTNLFYVYEINGSGLNTTPVIQRVGHYKVVPPFFPGGPTPSNWRESFLDASQDGKKLVLSSTNGKFVEMFDFDAFTGTISNPVFVDTGYSSRCAMFSPDDSKIYSVSHRDDGQPYWGIYQFEVNSADPAAMRASKKEVSTCLIPETQLKLAPDGKMYFINSRNNFGYPSYAGRDIGVINAPNESGALCQFDSLALTLPDTTTIAIYGFSHYVVRENRLFTHKRDTTICGPVQSMVLNAPAGYRSYEWDDGTAAVTRTINTRGVFWVKSVDNCITRIDTIVVGGVDLPFELGNDTVVCENPQPIVLRLPHSNVPIIWSDGSTGQELIVSKSGTYWASINEQGCTFSDTINIQLTHIPQYIGEDTLICVSADNYPPIVLTARPPSPAASVLWSTQSTNSSISVDRTGLYWVEVSEGACMDRDSIFIEYVDLTQSLGNDTIVCHDQILQIDLEANVPPGAEVTWSNGSYEDRITVKEAGEYSVKVKYGHCVGTDNKKIEQRMCDCTVMVPEAFSPNGDGLNDIFRPALEQSCPVKGYSLQIFNRWGEEVYYGVHGKDIRKGWDGTFKGEPAPTGAYMYQMILEVGAESNRISKTGQVMVVR